MKVRQFWRMRFIMYTLFALSFCSSAMGQPGKYSDTTYHITTGKHSSIPSTANSDTADGLTIQNSLPRGGRYTDPDGKIFGYTIFWNRVINRTAFPVELTINFPADSFAIFPEPGERYVKVFLPPGKMTFETAGEYDYGATGLKSFFDTDLHKPTRLQCTINPKEERLFYVAIIIRVPNDGSGGRGHVFRPGFVLSGQDLYYKISTAAKLDLALIPCGQIKIVAKK